MSCSKNQTILLDDDSDSDSDDYSSDDDSAIRRAKRLLRRGRRQREDVAPRRVTDPIVLEVDDYDDDSSKSDDKGDGSSVDTAELERRIQQHATSTTAGYQQEKTRTAKNGAAAVTKRKAAAAAAAAAAATSLPVSEIQCSSEAPSSHRPLQGTEPSTHPTPNDSDHDLDEEDPYAWSVANDDASSVDTAELERRITRKQDRCLVDRLVDTRTATNDPLQHAPTVAAAREEPTNDDDEFVLPEQASSSSSSSSEDEDEDECIRAPQQNAMQKQHLRLEAPEATMDARSLAKNDSFDTTMPVTVEASATGGAFPASTKATQPSRGSVMDYRKPAPLPQPGHDPSRSVSQTSRHASPPRPPLQANALDDDQLADAAFFDAITSEASRPVDFSEHLQAVAAAAAAPEIVDLCQEEDDDDDEDDKKPRAQVREGLHSVRKRPGFHLASPALENTGPSPSFNPARTDLGDDDIQAFSDDEQDSPFVGRSSLLSQTKRPAVATASQPHVEPGLDAPVTANNNENMSHMNHQYPITWQERPAQRRRLRDAAKSNTSLARAVVVRKQTTTTATNGNAATVQLPAWELPATAATHTNYNNNHDGSFRNQRNATLSHDFSSQQQQDPPMGEPFGVEAGYDHHGAENAAPWADAPRSYTNTTTTSRRQGGFGKKRGRKGGKRSGRGRGRGRSGYGSNRRNNNNGNEWGNGGGGGGSWSNTNGYSQQQSSRDDPNLGHVGGAEMNF